ncbi:hypothetical protein ATANTOWER_026526 [Ataeniobius toweri]|uniref:Uncharacterized protein n=1 Tax=Ataeniobius toweri TaxID=208326 RepID=A0ABU7AHL9_9TELE|nr:hypothetical protein [Ataeniobius toweri]
MSRSTEITTTTGAPTSSYIQKPARQYGSHSYLSDSHAHLDTPTTQVSKPCAPATSTITYFNHMALTVSLFTSYNKKGLDHLQVVQNSAARLLTGVQESLHDAYWPLFTGYQ